MKKFLSVILALVMLLAGATMVSADDGSGKKDVGEHEHILMDMSNAACHYSECTICFELFNVGDHTFVDGKCSVCGHASVYGNPTDEDIRGEGEHEHILMNGADIASHYEECQVCFVLFNVEDHTFVDGKCSVCGYRELINPFVDVPEDAWYHDEVVEAVATGIINGKTPTEFMPDDFLTYAEAVKLAACMNQVYLYGKVTLTAGEPWYKPYADYCRENGITTKDYDYNAKATRAGYMEIFANALPDEAFSDINAIVDGSILDVDGSAPYAIYVYKMYRAGIVTGVDEMHNCNPDANIKRCEVATIISRMMNEENRVRFNMGTDDETIGVIPDPEEEAQQPGTDNQKAESWDDPTNIPPENPEVANKVPVQEVTPDITVLPTVPVDIEKPVINSELTIHKQPEGLEADNYGGKAELEVQVFGGKAPYTYEWYYKDRRDNVTINNGDYAKDAQTEALVLSIEKENTLLGANIYCKITDSLGDSVTTNAVKVYGPFSMPVESYSVVSANKEYTVVGRVEDGVLRKGDKVSVIRNGKVIAIGVAKDLQMFNKSMDETVKGDNVGIVFSKDEGAAPSVGDIVVKYQPTHIVDTSDIVN